MLKVEVCVYDAYSDYIALEVRSVHETKQAKARHMSDRRSVSVKRTKCEGVIRWVLGYATAKVQNNKVQSRIRGGHDHVHSPIITIIQRHLDIIALMLDGVVGG